MLRRIKRFALNIDFPLFKEVMYLALPVIASNISRVFMHITDTAMVGHLGKNQLVAVAPIVPYIDVVEVCRQPVNRIVIQ